MKKKNRALEKYYYGTLVVWIMLLVLSIISLILLCIEGIKLLAQHNNAYYIVIILIVQGIVCIYFIVYTIIRLKNLLKDKRAIKNNNYISIEGKVIKFVKNIDLETGKQNNNIPIVEIVGTNDRVQLYMLDKVKIGETYIFHYLENSKIAEVIEKVENVNDAGNDM